MQEARAEQIADIQTPAPDLTDTTIPKKETTRYTVTKEGYVGTAIERDQEALKLEFERYRELNKQINAKLDHIFAENKLPFSATRNSESFMRISFLVGPEMVKSYEEKNSKTRWQVDDDQYAFMLHILANGKAQMVRAKADPLSPIFNENSNLPGPQSENFLFHVQKKLEDIKDFLAHFATNSDHESIAEVVGNTVISEYRTWSILDVSKIYESIESINNFEDTQKTFDSVLELSIACRKPMHDNALHHFIKYSVKACKTEADIDTLTKFLEHASYNRYTGTKLVINEDYLKQQIKAKLKEIKQTKKQQSEIQNLKKQISEMPE